MDKINGLTQQVRSPHSPSPIYGDGSLRMNTLTKNVGLLRPGFNVGDVDQSYAPSVLVYGTLSFPSTQWPPVGGLFPTATAQNNVPTITQTNTADSTGTIVQTGARVVKITINVTSSGSVTITAKSAADSYTAVVFNSGALTAGSYEFYVGGWATPSSETNNRSYQATQYGPTDPRDNPSSTNPTYDQEINPAKVNITADQNYVGSGYNPIEFLSLDGFALTFFSTKTGSPSWDVEMTPVS